MIDYVKVAESTKEFAPGGASAEIVYCRINHLRRMSACAARIGYDYMVHGIQSPNKSEQKKWRAKGSRMTNFAIECNEEIARLREAMK